MMEAYNHKKQTEPPSSSQSSDIKLALNRTNWNTIRPVCFTLAALYITFSVSHLFLLPDNIKIQMALLAVFTALILINIGWFAGSRRYSPVLTYPTILLCIALTAFNILLHLFLTDDINQTSNMMLIIIGAGFMIFSKLWFALALACCTLGWAVTVINLNNTDHLTHFSYAIFSSLIFSIATYVIRKKGLIKTEQLRLISEDQKKELEHLAMRDPLTGLGNRRLFFKHVNEAILQSNRSNKKLGVLYCDLNKFKPINDEYGHEFGDEVLKFTANTLNNLFRETDTIARLGGDEFAVILTNITNQESIAEICDKVDKAFKNTAAINGRAIEISMSVGSALYPDDATNSAELLDYADSKMYECKKQSK